MNLHYFSCFQRPRPSTKDSSPRPLHYSSALHAKVYHLSRIIFIVTRCGHEDGKAYIVPNADMGPMVNQKRCNIDRVVHCRVVKREVAILQYILT